MIETEKQHRDLSEIVYMIRSGAVGVLPLWWMQQSARIDSSDGHIILRSRDLWISTIDSEGDKACISSYNVAVFFIYLFIFTQFKQSIGNISRERDRGKNWNLLSEHVLQTICIFFSRFFFLNYYSQGVNVELR